MRLITPEEDKLLDQISRLKDDVRNIENEIMVAESGLKGNTRKRGSEFTTFLIWFVVSFGLFMITAGYILCGLSVGFAMSLGIFFGAGGAGFVVIACWIYTIIRYFRFRAVTSKSAFWQSVSEKMKIDSISSEDNSIQSHLKSYKKDLSYKRNKISELTSEYEDLRDMLDAEDELKGNTGLKNAKDGLSVNNDRNSLNSVDSYQIQFNWLEQKKTIKGELNKLIVRYNLLRNQREEIEDKINEYQVVVDEMSNSKRSMTIFCLCIGVVAGCVFLLATIIGDEINVSLVIAAVLIAIFAIVVKLLVDILTMPFLKDTKLANFIGITFSTSRPVKEINDYLLKIKDIDKEMVEVDELIEITKRDYEKFNESNDLAYRY